MDEHLHDIDNLFKKAAEQHADLPAADVWNRLEKDLQKRNISSITKKYKKWKWLALVLFMFSLGIGLYTYQLTRTYKNIIKKIESNSTSHSNTNTADNVSSGNPLKNTNILSHKKDNPGLPPNKEIPDSTMDTNPGQQQSITDALHPIAERETTKIKAGDSSSRINRPATKIHRLKEFHSNNTLLSEGTKKIPGVKELPANEPDRVKESEVIVSNSPGQRKWYNDKHDRAERPALSSSYKKTSHENNSTEIAATRENIDLRPASVDALSHSIKFGPYAIIPPTKTDSLYVDVIATGKGIKPQLKSRSHMINTATVFYSMEKISTSLGVNRPDFKEDNYLQIKNHEKYRLTNTIGFSLSRYLGRNFSIESGIGQSAYITDISSKPLVARKDNNGIVNYRISTSSGYAYYSIKAFPHPAIGDSIRTLSSKSRVKYISVPLGLLYNFNFSRFSITPAVIVSLNFKTTGKITTIQSLEHTYSNDLVGLKSRYFNGTIRLGISSFLGKRIGVTLMPFTRFGLSNPTEGKPVTTRRNSMGLAAGLNYRL